MLSVTSLRAAGFVRLQLRRNLATTSLILQQKQAVDPIQQIFVDKVREYAKKKTAGGGKLVDADATTEANLKKELEKVAKQYGGKEGEDMTKFPNMQFEEPALQDIDLK